MLGYSPLCDVSYSAYVAYLAANIADKSRYDVFVSVFRGESGREFDGSCADSRGYVRALDGGSVGSVTGDALAGVCDASGQGCADGDDDSGVDYPSGRVASAQGGAGDLSGCGGFAAVGAGGNCLLRETSEQVLECDSVVGGKWSRSNRKKKEKKRVRRVRAKVEVESAGDVEVGVESVSAPLCVGEQVTAPVRCLSGFDRVSLESVTSSDERKVLAREWYERKRAENALATQRATYNFKRNQYLDRAKISEKRWEQERLTCEQKLANITEARFGSKPGYAETLASVSDGSERPPSLSTGSSSPANLSDGTISPDSSMSVAEANRLLKKVEELSGRVVQLELEKKALTRVDVAGFDEVNKPGDCWFGKRAPTEYGDCSEGFEYGY